MFVICFVLDLNLNCFFFRFFVDQIQLDKASIIKDAIGYIQDLQEQERILQAEIREHESKRLKKHPDSGFEQELPDLLRSKRTRYDKIYHHSLGRSTCPIQVHEVSYSLPVRKTCHCVSQMINMLLMMSLVMFFSLLLRLWERIHCQ